MIVKSDVSVGIWKNAGKNCESDWGVIEHTRARVERGEVGSLILVSAEGYQELCVSGPIPEGESIASASSDDDGRLFYHQDYEGRRWTWELFDCHWTDIGPERVLPALYIGRWPD